MKNYKRVAFFKILVILTLISKTYFLGAIAQETEDSISGAIGRFRIKSDERVRKELGILKNEIGAKQIYIEDDSIFGMKRRAIRLLKSIVGFGLDLMDVNGI